MDKLFYKVMADMVFEKADKMGITFDFENNIHLNKAQNMDDVFKHFVFHSQNRGQGKAINFYDAYLNNKDVALADKVWEIVSSYNYFESGYNPNKLFENFSILNECGFDVNLTGGKSNSYYKFARTICDIKKYLDGFNNLDAFIAKFNFGKTSVEYNLGLIVEVWNQIHNIKTALTCDFFKEQEYITNHEYLIKPDTHVTNFFNALFDSTFSAEEVFIKFCNAYKDSNVLDDPKYVPYNVDKMIFLLGSKLRKTKLSLFAKEVREHMNSLGIDL